MLTLTHTEVTNAMPIAYNILDYGYRPREQMYWYGFGTPEILYVELRAKKLLKLHRLQ